METVEDAYTYYVLILGISENLFWDAECCELQTIVADKTAYDNWLSYMRYKLTERG